MSSFNERRQRRVVKPRHNKQFASVSANKSRPTPQSDGGTDMGIIEQTGSAVMGGLRAIDDSTQAFVRDNILRLPTDGNPLEQDAALRGLRQTLGHSVFKARSGYDGDNTVYRGSGTTNDNIGLGLSRALQGGAVTGLTSAGLNLLDLATSFGSAADYPEPNQLSL